MRVKLGVLVIDEVDGSFLEMNRALKRAMFPALLAIVANMEMILFVPLLLDYFNALWSPKKQTWHDKIAKSVVVNRR